MSPERRSVELDRGLPRGLSIAVGSGKGGVGKTSLVANLSIALGRAGLRVAVVDGDMGLANLDVLFGLTPQLTLEDFFRDRVRLEDIAIDGPQGVQVIAGGSGLPELTHLSPDELLRFMEGLSGLRERSDILLLDTAAGIGEASSRLWLLAERFLLVTWPEPAALVDAYAALKVLRRHGPAQEVGLVINGVDGAEQAACVHERLQSASRQFLGQNVVLDGYVLRDEAVADAARRQQPVIQLHPLSPASRCIERLALHFAALAGKAARGAYGRPWPRTCRAGEVLH